MALKSPCVVSSTCNCGGREIRTVDSKAAGKSLSKIDLGPVPTPAEVDAAVSALQSFLQESFSLETNSKWIQPLMNYSSILDSAGFHLICKGFQWLITDPTFIGHVGDTHLVPHWKDEKSSTFLRNMGYFPCYRWFLDKNVWDAINNIGVVEKLQELPSPGGSGKPGNFIKGDFGRTIISWILQMTLTKIGKLIENFVLLLNDTLRFPGKEKLKPEKRGEIDEKIQSAFLLSLVTMLIIFVARVQIA